MAKVTIIRPVSQEDSGQKIRVAAYCRVSSDSERQQNSCQVQFEYYSHKFENSETEILVDLYADSGISGLSADNRSEFQRMMQDCRKGRIDRIYTKSISRFARNTRDCLVYIRELKSLGITVCFEKENLDTAKNADEMMLTVMAGLA
ncbi:MAG: recombinase family protein, partial [Oscillospiraceae bacterium]|nr:recombinase family protein [Oscillospiraceae bacterium]